MRVSIRVLAGSLPVLLLLWLPTWVTAGPPDGRHEAASAANTFVRDSVGNALFKRAFSLATEDSVHVIDGEDLHYTVRFRFSMPGRPWIDEQAFVVLDSLYTPLPDRNYGIPVCSTPDACDYRVTAEEVIGIAKTSGLGEGLRPWQVSFHWYAGQVESYIWSIKNVLKEGRDHSAGDCWILDARNGTILQRGTYRATYCD
jgi:hypothetical protein